jgi:O-antigen ligase
MMIVIEASLMFCLTAAVLAFGGTEPISFAAIEVLLFAAAAVAIYCLKDLDWRISWRFVWIPSALVGLVALQLVPLPARLAGWLRPNPRPWNLDLPSNPATSFSSVSIAPYSTRAHLLFLACCVITYFFARALGQDRASRRRLIAWLLVLGTFEALYGLVQYLSGWQRIFAYVKKYNLEEATGTYVNRNHYAGFLELIIPFSVALVLYEHARSWRNGRAARGMKGIIAGENLSRIGLRLFAAIVMLAALIFSRSRMGILAGVASLVVMAMFSGVQRRAGMWIAGATMFCVTALVLWIGAGSAFERFGNISNEYASVGESRASLWKGTAQLIEGHPLFGSGLGTFPIAFTAVQSTFLGKFVNHAHNDYLEIANDLGIPAAILLFGSIVMLFVRLARKTASAEARFERAVTLGCMGSIAAILLHSLTDFNLYIPANALLFSLVLGLASAMCVNEPERAPASI